MNKIESCLKWGLFLLLIAVMGVYAFYILYNAEWLIGDDAFMLKHTAMGIPFPLSESILPETGFFRPFDYLHENIVLLFHSGKHNAFEHYIINAVSFLLCIGALIGILWKSIKPKNVVDYAIIVFGALLVASRLIGIYINIFGPIFGVYTYHMLAIFFMMLFYEKDSNFLMIASLWCWFYSMLIYENVCLVLFCIGLFTLLFTHSKLSKKQIVYNIALIGFAIAFILAYVVIIYLPTKGGTHYDPAHGSGVTFWGNALSMLRGQKFLCLAAIVWVWRQIQLLQKESTYHPIYDTLLWAAGGMVAGALILKLNWSMYYYDAILLSISSVAFFVYRDMKKFGPFVLLFLFLVFTVLHFVKVPSIIKTNQNDRIRTSACMQNISTAISCGCRITWYDNEEKELSSWDSIMISFRKMSSENYIQYLQGDAFWKYPQYQGGEDIILYPLEYDKYVFNDTVFNSYRRVEIGGTSNVAYYIKNEQ